MNKYLESLNWRYATKQFDPSKRVSDEDINFLLESIKLTASSYGLQPYEVLVITDSETKEKLKPVSWNQSQVVDASHVIVLANKNQFGEELIDQYIENVSETRNIPADQLKGYSDFMKSKLVSLSDEEKTNWTAKQAYIALGNLLSAAATIQVDTCPMEGFSAEDVDEILQLKEKNLTTAVIIPVGYRSSEDATQHYAKVRKHNNNLFTHI